MSDQNKQLQSLHAIELNVGEVGTTVRNGRKWYDQVVVTDIVDLVVQTHLGDKGRKVGTGRIFSKKLVIFFDILARDIDSEHEISSRNYSGLLASMRKAYGDDFDEDSLVTVLAYRRIA